MIDNTIPDLWDPDDPLLRGYSSADPGRTDPFKPKDETSITGDVLATKIYPPILWAVPNLICQGVSVIVAPPKAGKSWAMMDISTAIASGGKVFNKIEVEEGDVLYLALEDGFARLQRRMLQVLNGAPASKRVTFQTECPPLDQGGKEQIEDWIKQHPDARLVIIDVLAKVRPQPGRGSNAYDADYAAMGIITRLAKDHEIAIIVIHHTNKKQHTKDDDFLDEVSGTNGIAGAADTTIAFKRGRNDSEATLSITGRDVEEITYNARFDAKQGKWTILDKLPDRPPTTADVIEAWLKEHPDSGPTDIAAGTGIRANTVKSTLDRDKSGRFVKTGRGKYRCASHGDDGQDPLPAPL